MPATFGAGPIAYSADPFRFICTGLITFNQERLNKSTINFYWHLIGHIYLMINAMNDKYEIEKGERF